jgi:phosphatidylglycerophosphate synthase
MSIRTSSPSPCPRAPVREARAVFVRSFGLAMAAMPAPVLGGAVGTVPALMGLALFAGLLFVLERGVTTHHPHARLGTANRITLVRAAIACLITARAIEPAPLAEPERWLLTAVGAAGLMLDGVDGWAARRQGLASAFGARFDMEVDAFAILVLSLVAVKAGAVASWVLAIGAMRYLYLIAGMALPLLRRPLPSHPVADRRRKAIAVIQSVVLLVTFCPVTPQAFAGVICAVALSLLAYSFAADIVILAVRRMGDVE